MLLFLKHGQSVEEGISPILFLLELIHYVALKLKQHRVKNEREELGEVCNSDTVKRAKTHDEQWRSLLVLIFTEYLGFL